MAFCITVVFTVILVSQGGLAEILLNPSNLRLEGGGTGRVDVTCRVPAGNPGKVSLIRITRNTTAQPGVEQGLAVANILSSTTQGKAVLSSGGLSANLATVSGGTSEKSVALTMTQADCQDVGIYRCSITINTGTEDNPVTSVLKNDQNLTVTALLGNIITSITPDDISYAANVSVELLCKAVIGNFEQGKEKDPVWIWEYYDVHVSTWRKYAQKGNIRTETPMQAGNCVYRQTCYLTLVLSAEDSKRQYRCTVQQNGDNASAIITLGVVSSQGQIHAGGETDHQPDVGRETSHQPDVGRETSPRPDAGGETDPSKASDTGAIVGGVIGGLVVIGIVIVLIFFLKYRKRDSGEKYQPDVGKEASRVKSYEPRRTPLW